MSVCVSNLNHTARHAFPLFQGVSLFFRENGQDWIRTSEGVSQRIYSPPRLATSVPTRFCEGAFYTRDAHTPQEFVSKNLPPRLALRLLRLAGRFARHGRRRKFFA